MTTAESFLNSLPRFTESGKSAYKPGLQRMELLLEGMGNPHRGLRCIHIAGTNGKGTTASLIASIAGCAGLRTGLYTSPHLVHLGERIRVNGVRISSAALDDLVADYRDLITEAAPSYFEALTALAFRYFADQEVDLLVLETGLGGRLDATNVIQPLLSVITSISLDHTDILGETIEAIAAEKAGIIKSGVPVVTSAEGAARGVIQEHAARVHAPLHIVQDEVQVGAFQQGIEGSELHLRTPVRAYAALRTPLMGVHQSGNISLAVRAAELLGMDEVAIRCGCREVVSRSGLRGRLEIIHRAPLVVLDVSHNEAGIAAALAYMRTSLSEGGRLHVAFGIMADKDVNAIAAQLGRSGAVIHPVTLHSARALPAPSLEMLLQASGATIGNGGDVRHVLKSFLTEAANGDALLIVGSFQLAAELLDN